MKKVIGVHFWERMARLCFCDADSVNMAEINLPADIRRLNIVANDFSIKAALEAIDTFVKEKMNLSEYSLVIGVSDDTGLKETQLLYKCAKDMGIDIIRTVTETMAMAYYSFVAYELSGPVMMAFASPAKLAVAQYYIDRGKVITEDTFIADRWNASTIRKTDFLSSASKRFFDSSDAEVMLCAGSSDKCMDFNVAVEHYVSTSNTFNGRNVKFKMIGDESVIEGIGYICGKLEGREAFQGIDEEITLTPYDVFVSVNGQMYPIMEMNTLVPGAESIEVESYPESKKTDDEILVFEKRGNMFVKACRITIPKEKMEYFYQKACEFTLKSDENRRITFIVKNVMGEKEVDFKLIDYMTLEEEKEVKSESISDLIVKLIPIIDDLEYAVKYSKNDDNPYIQGIMKTYDKAMKILEENDVQVITGIGKEFDYNYQTAVMHVDDESLPYNTVKDVMQSGYVYKGKVLRPASVVVAN